MAILVAASQNLFEGPKVANVVSGPKLDLSLVTTIFQSRDSWNDVQQIIGLQESFRVIGGPAHGHRELYLPPVNIEPADQVENGLDLALILPVDLGVARSR